MKTKAMTPVLLAASIFMAGSLLLASPAQARPIDMRVTSVDELTDVSSKHWAYEAVKNLVEKCDAIEGYPSKKFKGTRYATRWELAAALSDLQDCFGRDLARAGAQNKADLETLARLQDEFKDELAVLGARTDALESRASAIEAKNAEQDTRLSLLEKTQIHGDFSAGLLSNVAGNNQEDAIGAIARLRLSLDIPVVEEQEGSYLGEGKVHARLIAAAGNNASLGAPGFSGLSRIAADRSAFNEGFDNGNGALNTNSRLNMYVERLYYTQDLKPGIPVLTNLGMGDGSPEWDASGQVFAGIVPWRDYFDKSKYRGNELTQFQNSSFVNLPGLPMNANMAMIGYAMKQGLGEKTSFNLTAALGAPSTDDVLNTYLITYEGRLNYNLPIAGDLPGSFYVGGYHTLASGSTSGNAVANQTASTLLLSNGVNAMATGALVNQAQHGVYVGVDQELYKGIGTNIGYFYNGASDNATLLNSLNSINGNGFNTAVLNGRAGTLGGNRLGITPRQALSAVFNVPMETIAPGLRDGDHFGVGYAAIDFAQNIGADDGMEQVMETYYTYYLNDHVSFVPSFQLSKNRLGVGGNDVSLGFGFRTNVQF